MNTVTSRDGTKIAFDKAGQGPAVIVVDGALCYRANGPSAPLARLLERHFTVYTYDRRGRGDSGDTAPYAVEREVEDFAALLAEAGGAAFVYGISSGAALALEAANRLPGITKLALYEAPFIIDDSRPPVPQDSLAQIKAIIAADRRSDAVRYFMKQVGASGVIVALMRFMPVWSKLKVVAHTIPYDFTILDGRQAGKPLPTGRWAAVTTPTLVMDGGKSDPWIRHATASLAQILPNAQYRTLPGQTHMLKPEALAPVLVEFFADC